MNSVLTKQRERMINQLLDGMVGYGYDVRERVICAILTDPNNRTDNQDLLFDAVTDVASKQIDEPPQKFYDTKKANLKGKSFKRISRDFNGVFEKNEEGYNNIYVREALRFIRTYEEYSKKYDTIEKYISSVTNKIERTEKMVHRSFGHSVRFPSFNMDNSRRSDARLMETFVPEKDFSISMANLRRQFSFFVSEDGFSVMQVSNSTGFVIGNSEIARLMLSKNNLGKTDLIGKSNGMRKRFVSDTMSLGSRVYRKNTVLYDKDIMQFPSEITLPLVRYNEAGEITGIIYVNFDF